MENEVILKLSKKIFAKRELFDRLLSSFLFVPVIALIFVVPYWAFVVLSFLTYFLIVHEILSPQIEGHVLLRSIALFFCCIGMLSFVFCRKNFGPHGCGFLICISSLTDTGGYLFGKAFGGKKLCPKISPKKTWTGAIGGVILANIGIFFLKDILLKPSHDGSCIATWFGHFAIIQLLILSAIFGDLLESMFKRHIKVKDMGNILPGHGGMLDRLDSLLLASIVLFCINIAIR